jgi:hypothetical protein
MRKNRKNKTSNKTKIIIGIVGLVVGILLITSLIFIFENKDKINKLQSQNEQSYVMEIEKR